MEAGASVLVVIQLVDLKKIKIIIIIIYIEIVLNLNKQNNLRLASMQMSLWYINI